MLTSILLRSKNEAKDLAKTLKIIREQSVTSREIIIVDSGSTDGTLDLVQQQRDIKLVQIAPEEFNYSRALNMGCEAARGDIIVPLSPHAFPCDQHWLQNLLKHFNDSQVAGVYGKQIPHLNAWPPVQRDYLSSYNDQLTVQTNPNNFRDHFFSNSNSAIRRQCWEKHIFDENLIDCEDWEWAKAMLQLGYRIIYEPEAAVYHSHNESLIKVYKRSYSEALGHKELYQWKMPLRQAFQTWQKLVSDDIEFILQNDHNRQWLLRVPIYRLFFTLGHLRPHLPNALWEPFVNRWQRIIDKFSKEQIKE